MTTVPIASYCSADVAHSKTSQSCADMQAEAGAVTTPTISCSDISGSSSDEETAPLPLEVDIPKERLPDVLFVYDKYTLPGLGSKSALWGSLEKFLACNPIKFVRKYPPSYTDTVCDMSKASDTLNDRTIGQLDLRKRQYLGIGKHSQVYLAPLSVPTCAGPSLCREVAIKLAQCLYDKKMLEHEAKMYDKFPRELQESTPSSTPIVPRFYGYYKPSCESASSYKGEDGDEEDANTVRTHVSEFLESASPMLLLEPCGEQVELEQLSTSDKETIAGLFDRLHKAGFTQGSVYPRNILVQPGSLTLPSAVRSLDNPSYRIIDFGRGLCRGEGRHTDEEMRQEQSMEMRSFRDHIFYG